VASVWHLAPIHLGLDVHRDTISVAILAPDQQVPEVDRAPTTAYAQRFWVKNKLRAGRAQGEARLRVLTLSLLGVTCCNASRGPYRGSAWR
jgi:hypothetical protein